MSTKPKWFHFACLVIRVDQVAAFEDRPFTVRRTPNAAEEWEHELSIWLVGRETAIVSQICTASFNEIMDLIDLPEKKYED